MWELFHRSGIVAWPLGVCSVLALGIILERLFTLYRLRQAEDRAFGQLKEALSRSDRTVLADPAVATAPVARIVQVMTAVASGGDEDVRQAADIGLSLQRQRLRRYLGTLATIGSTAPFIGLFGTVLGVMAAFQAMSHSGLSGEAMAAGISEALSATALGLLVAIPSVIAYNYYGGRAQAMALHIHSHVVQLVPLLDADASRQEA